MELAWLEQEMAESPKSAGMKPAPVRRETMQVRVEWLEEESKESVPARRRSSKSVPVANPKRTRQAWEPPTLPPPAANATKSRRVLPPPLPREEPEEKPARRPSKAPSR